MKIAVIYASKYGATRRYAEWIAERLGATLLKRTAVKPAQLDEYGQPQIMYTGEELGFQPQADESTVCGAGGR